VRACVRAWVSEWVSEWVMSLGLIPGKSFGKNTYTWKSFIELSNELHLINLTMSSNFQFCFSSPSAKQCFFFCASFNPLTHSLPKVCCVTSSPRNAVYRSFHHVANPDKRSCNNWSSTPALRLLHWHSKAILPLQKCLSVELLNKNNLSNNRWIQQRNMITW
jgi:hypothetical protein